MVNSNNDIKIYQNTQLLNRLGILRWINRDYHHQYYIKSIDDWHNFWQSSQLLHQKISITEHVLDTESKIIPLVSDSQELSLQELGNESEILALPELNIPMVIDGITVLSDRISVFAIRYQDWLILADGDEMGAEHLAIWYAMGSALIEKCNHQGMSIALQYTPNDFWLSKKELYWLLSGFFWQLNGATPPKRMAVLTNLTSLLLNDDFFLQITNTPSLQEMVDNPMQKKVFWQLLHQ